MPLDQPCHRLMLERERRLSATRRGSRRLKRRQRGAQRLLNCPTVASPFGTVRRQVSTHAVDIHRGTALKVDVASGRELALIQQVIVKRIDQSVALIGKTSGDDATSCPQHDAFARRVFDLDQDRCRSIAV